MKHDAFSRNTALPRRAVPRSGFSLVEVVSTCPTNWGLDPVAACKFVEEKMIPFYPLGVYKDRTQV